MKLKNLKTTVIGLSLVLAGMYDKFVNEASWNDVWLPIVAGLGFLLAKDGVDVKSIMPWRGPKKASQPQPSDVEGL